MAQSEDRRREALIQAGLTLASELSLPSVLQKITDLACEVADARYGALGVIGASGELEDFITHGVTEEERRAIGDLPRGRGILGVLIKEAHPLRLEHIQSDSRSVGFPPNHPPMTTFLGVPVKVRGSVFGNLYLTEKRGGGPFTKDDEAAVQTLAAQAGVAIENARIRDELERFAVLEDRERIAQELHDGVIQSLFAVGMSLQAADALAGDVEAMRERLSAAVDDIDRAIRDLRNYIFALRPGGAADHTLDRAFRELVEGFASGAEAEIELAVDPEAASIVATRAGDLVLAAREALSNAVRHSGASRVRVSLEREGDVVVLRVVDDGRGFSPKEARGQGHGLANLEARTTALGGKLEIESGEGGTSVVILVPVSP